MAYDLKTEYVFKEGDPKDANAEFDHPDTVQIIQESIEAMGHRVVRLGGAEQVLKAWDRLGEVDMVFNIAEGYTGRNREAQVPVLLEMKGVPFSGSDGLTQALTLDKLMTKKVLVAEGIPTPRFFEVSDPNDLPRDLAFPLIVKPRFEGSSKGLSESSRVSTPEALREQARWVIETYHQPALVEEFIRGNEFTVAVIGNEPPEALPVVRIQIDGKNELGDLFYTNARIVAGAQYIVPAGIDPWLEGRLQDLAIRVFKAVDCRDFGRVDFRVDEQGNPYVLEINPLPSLSTEDVFGIMAKHLGMTYGQMIARIVETAAVRHGLARPAGQAAKAK